MDGPEIENAKTGRSLVLTIEKKIYYYFKDWQEK